MKTKIHYYVTRHELNFINNLGNHQMDNILPKNRKKCLIGYLKGCELRDDWAGLDKKVCVAMAEALLVAES